jgi:hypothetical protein
MTQAPISPPADPYDLVSVRAVGTPSGATGTLWHRYEILQGGNRIVGYRQGRFENVTVAVEAIVLQLNERRLHQRGRVHLTPQSKSRPSRSDGA